MLQFPPEEFGLEGVLLSAGVHQFYAVEQQDGMETGLEGLGMVGAEAHDGVAGCSVAALGVGLAGLAEQLAPPGFVVNLGLAGREETGEEEKEENGGLVHTLLIYILEYEAADVVAKGQEHEGKDEGHADVLEPEHYLLAGLAAGDGLVEQNDDVTAVKSGDGEDVHDGEGDADEGGEHPEAEPVPGVGEEVADGDEGAYLLGALGSGHVAELVDVGNEGLPSVVASSGDACEEVVVGVLDLVVGQCIVAHDAHHVVVVELEGDGVGLLGSGVLVDDGHAAQAEAVSMGARLHGEDVLATEEEGVVVAPVGYGGVVDGEQAAASLQSGTTGGALGQHGVYQGGCDGDEEGRLHVEYVDEVQSVLGHLDGDLAAIAQDGDGLGLAEVLTDGSGPSLDVLVVEADGDVAVAEAEGLGFLVEGEALGDVLHGHAVLAFEVHDAAIDNESREEVHEDASGHDEESLPDLLATEFVGLGRLLQLLGVEAFVDHAGYLDVSAQGYPAYAVLGLVVAEVGEEAGEPVVAGAEEVELVVEEHEELLDAHLEEFGESEVPALVEHDEQREAEQEL